MECLMTLGEVPLHLYQITAGFKKLDDMGLISLKINRQKRRDKNPLPYNMLEVRYKGKCLVFDMNDGYDNLLKPGQDYVEFYNDLLNRCDFLFKRSFKPKMNSKLQGYEKIKKTAPNFFVSLAGNPAHALAPCDPLPEKFKKVYRALPTDKHSNACVDESIFSSYPKISPSPKILFISRLWDPEGEYKGQLTEEKSLERHHLNSRRIACLIQAQKEFGPLFIGGLVPNDYAIKNYPQLVIEGKNLTYKKNYLNLLKKSDIALTSMGLHKSTGWKFAEYIAASKAIVCQPLYYQSAGDLAEGKNYLAFSDEFDMCEKIHQLMDSQKRFQMMRANKSYYEKYMRCDVNILRALSEV
ncbi:MAG: glycosyltransferase family 1 protein [Clostridiales bacterium]|nr:glycosyltransferase family 1 protein [Clostridiales bacterium]